MSMTSYPKFETWHGKIKQREEHCAVQSFYDGLRARGLKPGDKQWPTAIWISCTCSRCHPISM